MGAAVAAVLILCAVAFTAFAPSDGANIGGGMLIAVAAFIGAACYGIGRLIGERRG